LTKAAEIQKPDDMMSWRFLGVRNAFYLYKYTFRWTMGNEWFLVAE
jgi:hypothetical protein